MAVPLYIIRLTQEIDEGNRASYEKLKQLAKTNPDAKRVLKTVKEPPAPSKIPPKVAAQIKQDTAEETAAKAKQGDAQSIAVLRKKAGYEDIKAQCALGCALESADPDEAVKWFIKSSSLEDSRLGIARLAMKGNEKAKEWMSGSPEPVVSKRAPIVMGQTSQRDELGYYKPPTKHSEPKIGDVYRLNDVMLQTGQKNTYVVVMNKKGKFITVATITGDKGRHKCQLLAEPMYAGLTGKNVYVILDANRQIMSGALMQYRGSLSPRDMEALNLH